MLKREQSAQTTEAGHETSYKVIMKCLLYLTEINSRSAGQEILHVSWNPCAQKPATLAYPEPVEPCPHPHMLFFVKEIF
jgi:hypothetical protein